MAQSFQVTVMYKDGNTTQLPQAQYNANADRLVLDLSDNVQDLPAVDYFELKK